MSNTERVARIVARIAAGWMSNYRDAAARQGYADKFWPQWTREAEEIVAAVSGARNATAENWQERAERAERLVQHIWLHITSDEDFSADELKLDIEKAMAGEINELRNYPEMAAALADLCDDIGGFFGGRYGSPAFLRAKTVVAKLGVPQPTAE